MYEEILKKLEILAGRTYSSELKKELRNMEMTEFLFTMMVLDGYSLCKDDIRAILRGEQVKRGRLEEHIVLRRYIELYQAMCEMLRFENDIDLSVIGKIYGLSSGLEIQPIRREKLNLPTFDYIPPNSETVMDRMRQMLRKLYEALEPGSNILKKAAYLHNEIIAVSPYKYGNEALARAVMYYYLMTENFPIFEVRVKEQDYNLAVMDYLKGDILESFYVMLEKNLYNKLSAMIIMTES